MVVFLASLGYSLNSKNNKGVSFLAVKIRLTRVGAHKKPFYRVVVANSSSPRDGKFIEKLGTYDPFKEEDKFNFDVEKAFDWIRKGAQPTEIIASYLSRIKN